MFEQHRISLEPRSGIWLLFYETLIYPLEGVYKQQLLRIFKDFDSAEEAAFLMIKDRKVNSPLIVRDDSHRHEILRQA